MAGAIAWGRYLQASPSEGILAHETRERSASILNLKLGAVGLFNSMARTNSDHPFEHVLPPPPGSKLSEKSCWKDTSTYRVCARSRGVVLVVEEAGDVECAARLGWHPQVGAAGVEDNLEGLRRGAEVHLSVILRAGPGL